MISTNRVKSEGDFNGKKIEYILEKGLSLSQKMSFVVEVAGTVVSKEVGYAQILRQPIFEYCLITYYTNIVLFENGEDFSLDRVDKFIKDNKENILDIIPIMQNMDNREVAKAIVKEFNNKKDLSYKVSKSSVKGNKERKLKVVDDKYKAEFTVKNGEKTE